MTPNEASAPGAGVVVAGEPDFSRWLRPGPGWWAEFERAFLGPTHEPLARRAADAGWRPDGAGAYCPRCAGTVGPHEVGPILGPGSALGCNECRDRRLRWARAVRLGPYEGVLREWIQELKFARFRPAGWALGRLLGARLAAELGVELGGAGIERSGVRLVPVPMSRRRRLARGIDHTLVLARGVREVTGLRIARLLKRRHRPSQLEVPASRRRANASGSFIARRAPAGVRVVVVLDDVRTTGATLAAACRALARAEPVSRGSKGAGGVSESRPLLWVAVAGVTPRPGEGRGRGRA